MGAVALVALWLVFFAVRKLIGVALVAALVIGAWMVWNNPALLQEAFYAISDFLSDYV
jgi:hypothetical protein